MGDSIITVLLASLLFLNAEAGVSFNYDREVCCDGNVLPVPDDGIERWYYQCCGTSVYNQYTELCCEDQIVTKPEPDEPNKATNYACCGTLPFHIAKQECKDGAIVQTNYESCDSNTYGNDTHLCCAGRLHEKLENSECCGLHRLNTEKEACCYPIYASHVKRIAGPYYPNGHVIEKSKPEQLCCGQDQVYDPATDICCPAIDGKDKVWPQTGNLGCCGATTYDQSKEVCCYGQGQDFPTSKSKDEDSACCEKSPYNPYTELCCDGKVHSIPTGEGSASFGCCGKEIYDPMQHTCCGTELYKYEANQVCCMSYSSQNGSVAIGVFDLSSEECCDGNIVPRKENQYCCGKTLISEKTSVCCTSGPNPGDTVSVKKKKIDDNGCCVPNPPPFRAL